MGCLHPSPVGERATAGTCDLPGLQLDDPVVLSVVVRFHDSVSVVDRSAKMNKKSRARLVQAYPELLQGEK